MRLVQPEAYLIAHSQPDYDEMIRYLDSEVGEGNWDESHLIEKASGDHGGTDLTEFAGRMCYKSWAPGINPNVRKIRSDQTAYIANVIASGHGSVLEHAVYTFALQDISRVCTHELVRHRAGTAISQESLRFVRAEDIPFWMPGWAQDDQELMTRGSIVLDMLEKHQAWMASHFGLDEDGVSFSEKKHKTSFMRRFLPEGIATQMTFTVNARELRHIAVARTDGAAEEEIRIVAGKMLMLAREQDPLLFADLELQEDESWKTQYSKV